MTRGGLKRPGWLRASALGLGLVSVLSCAPRASSVPLGLGPLAVAERDAEVQSAASRRPGGLEPPRRSRVASPAAAKSLAKADEPKVDESAASPDEDEGSEPDKPSSTTPTPLEGMYAGDDIAVFRLSGFPEREQRDDKAKIRIDSASSGNVSITLINSEDGSDLCELVARVDGNAALIESAQPCFSSGGEGSLEAQLTSGRAVLDGDRLRMNAEGTLSVALPDQELDGDMTYTFEGERQ